MPPENTENGSHNLGDLAYRTIRQMLLERELPGGSAVVEGRLAVALNISRTPIREALLRLNGEGLLVRSGARSFTARTVKAAEHFQSLQVREWLECKAIDLAIDQLPAHGFAPLRQRIEVLGGLDLQAPEHWQVDDELHMLCPKASGNQVLARLIAEARVTNRLFELMDPNGRVEDDRREHLALVDALEARDASAAKEAMITHLRNLGDHVVRRLRG